MTINNSKLALPMLTVLYIFEILFTPVWFINIEFNRILVYFCNSNFNKIQNYSRVVWCNYPPTKYLYITLTLLCHFKLYYCY